MTTDRKGQELDLVKIHRKNTAQTEPDTDGDSDGQHDKSGTYQLARPRTHTLGRLKLRAEDDHDPTDWWFASTAIPLIAATFAPMANMLSIAALVVYWRNDVHTDDPVTRYSMSTGIADPKWCLDLNAASLACGFAGNLFLLFNFTKRVRYIVALPLTIIFFYIAAAILIGIIVSMDRYVPPGPNQVYSQGFWHAVIAACLYMLNSMILMVNMAGYFLGHYPQHFTLTDEQRNLILQTMLFFIWLGGGAGVFAHIEPDWGYPDALYFCDVTILTIGFGDFYATNDLGRGLVFPFSVGGTIILGLMVSSIHKFAKELSKDKVVRNHVEKARVNTLSRAVTAEQMDEKAVNRPIPNASTIISGPSRGDAEHIQMDLDRAAQQAKEKPRAINFQDARKEDYLESDPSSTNEEPAPSQFFSRQPTEGNGFRKSLRTLTMPLSRSVSMTTNSMRRVTTRSRKQILMLEERDRFNAMRSIQINATNFKRYYALTMSIISFGLLWCLGALVFHLAETDTQEMSYFQGLYLCYVSLLTIGYGDLSPKSNAGKAFFLVWSLIAVPTMTILVSDLGDTVIGGFKRSILKNDLGLTSGPGSSRGQFRTLAHRLLIRKMRPTTDPRKSVDISNTVMEEGNTNPIHDDEIEIPQAPATIEELANERVSEAEMMRKLAYAIRRVAEDLKSHPGKKYSYEEWVEFTRLIRFSKLEAHQTRNAMRQLEYDEETEGVVEWDWLDEKSPMTSEQSESEWVLDRLCESLLRIFKKSDLLLGLSTTNQSVEDPGASKDTNDSRPAILANDGIRSNSIAMDPTETDKTKASNMNPVMKFFRGEVGYGQEPRWSKRARANMVTTSEVTRRSADRRRSSVSSRHGRSGPFAAVRNVNVFGRSRSSEDISRI